MSQGFIKDVFSIVHVPLNSQTLQKRKGYRDIIFYYLIFELISYHWEEFIEKVLGEKLNVLQSYIKNNDEHDKALLYKMLQLIESREEENKLNIARFTYLLARLRPDAENAKENEITAYNDFAKNMYRWIRNDNDCRHLKTAIYIYVYMNRERNDKNGKSTR